MWATLAALGHWFHMGDEPVMQFIGVDDGGRAIDLTFLLGSAFLTTLDAMERMGWLKPGSEMRDLGLVMSMWLQWSFGLPDYGIEGDDGKITWRKDIIAYAKRGNIDLKASGHSGIEKRLKEFEDVEPLQGAAKVGRWEWPSKVSEGR